MALQNLRDRIQSHRGDDSQLRALLERRMQRRGSRGPTGQQSGYMPWSGAYESSVGSAIRNRDFEMAQTAGDEAALERDYGFNDPTNPFSRSMEIQRGFERQQRGTLTNYAGEGQLYSGALGRAQGLDRENFERDMYRARTDYDDQLRALYERRLGSQYGFEDDLLDAEAQRLEDAIQEPVDPQEAPPGRRRNRRRNR